MSEPSQPDSTSADPAPPADAEEATAQFIDINQFGLVDLRTAEVVSADVHPKADRLLVLQLALADERRQVVAGIRGHYEPADLVGRTVVVVANLKPVRLRGVDSQGMCLAVRDGDRVVLLSPESAVASGLQVS